MLKKNVYSLFVLLSVLFVSCGTNKINEVEFVINNNEDFALKNCVVSLSNDSEIKTESFTVESKSSKNVILNMECAQQKDGSYIIKCSEFTDGKSFGYYTNGHALEKTISITIENGEVKIQ